jgi:ferredoxin-type protein NapF
VTRAIDNSRRNLLKGVALSTTAPVRPPGAIDEADFVNGCTTCGDCISACPEGIIISGSGAYPEIDFRRGECTFCTECASACPESVIDASIRPLWLLNLRVEDRCLAKNRVICQTCGDVCDQQAIRFRPRLGAVAVPEIRHEDCNGCGACVSACPEYALLLDTKQPVAAKEGAARHV